jgi:ABC-type Zn uptake system ZnuABC Zn-binding protein ZnuA
VLAAESFLADIAQNVAGDRLTVETLVPPGVDPHEFEPAPQDIAKIAQSRMLIVNGLGYETWLQKTLENGGGSGLVIVASKGLTPNVDPSGEHAQGDPHMWMNPINVIRYVENIRDGLTQIDPAGKATYARNADAYTYRLRDLDQMARRQTSYVPPEKRLLVTNHDALGYFAQAYGFKFVGAVIPSVTDAASPSAQELSGLIKAIKSSGARAIFLNVGENQTLAQQIAAETGVKVVSDLYVEGLSAPGGPAATYMDMIQYDVTQIIAALQ